MAELLAEFELEDVVEADEHGYRVGVSTYLALADGLDGERWRLVSRELAEGAVPVTEDEFHELLREAIHDRVAEGLPLDVPEEIADALAPRVAELRAELADHGADWDFEEVDTALFPPC
ncbi:MAG: DNA primase regulatory subunit PriL, partial [Actinobacteria bacterium]|nr:DNA primase regulatory subunit PriL [Actinomycetota bacterium]